MVVQKRVLVLAIVGALLLAVGLSRSLAQPARALPGPGAEQAGVTIPYTGRLSFAEPDERAERPVTDGVYDFTFTLYAVESGGEPLWSEMQRSVVVSQGEFQTSLGNVVPIPEIGLSARDGWVEVAVRGPDEAGFTALAPRQRVSAAKPTTVGVTTAGPTCPHDHFGERWIGDSGALIDGLYVENTRPGGTGVAGKSNSGDGVVGESSNIDKSGVYGNNTGSGYGVFGRCSGLYCDAMFSDGGMVVAGRLWVDSSLTVQGYATFSGGKNGYVVDIAQNDDTEPLEAGDVVVISGAGPAVVGEIPVIKVHRATDERAQAVVGIADRRYSPVLARVGPDGRAASAYEEAAIAPGAYLTVVTLGAYQRLKVDASYGPITAGDLLVASPNPGYAMRAVAPQPGTVIGKALGELQAGTGVIPVIVTLQ